MTLMGPSIAEITTIQRGLRRHIVVVYKRPALFATVARCSFAVHAGLVFNLAYLQRHLIAYGSMVTA